MGTGYLVKSEARRPLSSLFFPSTHGETAMECLE